MNGYSEVPSYKGYKAHVEKHISPGIHENQKKK
jgi:hypothetical protein